MPKKRDRTRLRQLLDRIERDIKRRRKRELEEHRRFLRRYLDENFRRIDHEHRTSEQRDIERAYYTWYNEVYRNIRFRVVRYSTLQAIRNAKKRDYVDTNEKRNVTRLSIFTRFRLWLRRYITRAEVDEYRDRPLNIVRRIMNSIEVFRTLYDIRAGRAFAPITTIWKDRYLEIHIDKNIERWLTDPERREATIEALNHIFRQILATKQRIVIPPQDYERLKGVLRLIYKYYVSYTRPMPCRRTQMAIKLTPITIHYFRGYATRIYVIRWFRKEQMESGLVQVTDNIDIHFRWFRYYKYRGDILSTMAIAGDTDSLKPEDKIPAWRDATGLPRDILYLFEAMYLYHRIEDGLRRALGKRENDASTGHCSIYIGFRKQKPYKKIFIKRYDRDAYRRYRWD